MKAILLAGFLLVALITFGQSKPDSTSPYHVDCKTIASAYGCASYNDMIDKKDAEILQSISNNSTLYVCFRNLEDAFALIGFNEPPAAAFHLGASKKTSLADGMVKYSRYVNGTNEDIQLATGKWVKVLPAEDNEVIFAPMLRKGGVPDTPIANINDSEITFRYHYENVSRTETLYIITLRRSTLRFNELWESPDPKTKQSTQRTESGTCVAFK